MKRTRIFIAALFMMAGATFLISFNARENSVAADKKAGMIADWERAKAYTLDYINTASEEAITFKPTPEMRSFAQQYLHLSEANYGLGAAASGKTSPYNWGDLEKSDRYNTKAALAKVVGDSYDFVIAGLKDMNDQKFAEPIMVFNFDLTRESTFNKVFEHQTHHRGQTTVYLRLKGIKPPEEKLF